MSLEQTNTNTLYTESESSQKKRVRWVSSKNHPDEVSSEEEKNEDTDFSLERNPARRVTKNESHKKYGKRVHANVRTYEKNVFDESSILYVGENDAVTRNACMNLEHAMEKIHVSRLYPSELFLCPYNKENIDRSKYHTFSFDFVYPPTRISTMPMNSVIQFAQIEDYEQIQNSHLINALFMLFMKICLLSRLNICVEAINQNTLTFTGHMYRMRGGKVFGDNIYLSSNNKIVIYEREDKLLYMHHLRNILEWLQFVYVITHNPVFKCSDILDKLLNEKNEVISYSMFKERYHGFNTVSKMYDVLFVPSMTNRRLSISEYFQKIRFFPWDRYDAIFIESRK